MSDKSFADVAADYAAWEDSRCPNLAHAEDIIDELLAQLTEAANEMGRQDAQLTHNAIIIEHQSRTIAGLQAEVARLRTAPRVITGWEV
jgi:uncharacterized coiled-coil protein SlyX